MLRAYIMLNDNIKGYQLPKVYLLKYLLALHSHRASVLSCRGLQIDANSCQLFLQNGLQTAAQSLNNSILQTGPQTQLLLQSITQLLYYDCWRPQLEALLLLGHSLVLLLKLLDIHTVKCLC